MKTNCKLNQRFLFRYKIISKLAITLVALGFTDYLDNLAGHRFYNFSNVAEGEIVIIISNLKCQDS